jgi:hypothetical protein
MPARGVAAFEKTPLAIAALPTYTCSVVATAQYRARRSIVLGPRPCDCSSFYFFLQVLSLMETHKTDSPAAESKPATAAPPQGSAMRLAVLLGILALVLGALAYDQLMAKPNCEAADSALEEFVQKTNAMPVTKEGGGIVSRADVQKHFGWGPTWVVDNPADGYTVEYYCWWGKMPLLSRQRQFITVLYKGKSRRYSSHYRSEPPKEDLPSTAPPKAPDQPADDGKAKKDEGGDENKKQPEKDASEAPPANKDAPKADADKEAQKADANKEAPKADAGKEAPAGDKANKEK